MKFEIKVPFYVTTPIYYPNDSPHIGTIYTTLAADITCRWAKLNGQEAFFLTGLDEHGKKIENAANKQGISPQELVNKQAEIFKLVFNKLNIKYDYFIRTTSERHKRSVKEILNKVYSKGDIYKGKYKGLYCVDCETYYTEKDLIQRICPIHKRPTEMLEEDCYFFKLSKYQNWLLQYFETHREFVKPSNRFKEMINIVKEGLEDLNISRSNFKWGIPLPFDNEHITYVWFDALINYLSGINYFENQNNSKKLWEHSVHIIGKDILRFHSIVWLAMLKSIDINPPKEIFAHGFWTINGEKFSKSLGNSISPQYLIDIYGLDTLRYYLFRSVPFGLDGNFSEAELVQRNNSELAQGLGNLLQRTTRMIEKYCQNKIPIIDTFQELEGETIRKYNSILRDFRLSMEKLDFHNALAGLWTFITHLNVYINIRAPWTLTQVSEKDLLYSTLATLAEGIRTIALLISPFMPDTSNEIFSRLGISEVSLISDCSWGNKLGGKIIKHKEPIFPLKKLQELKTGEKGEF